MKKKTYKRMKNRLYREIKRRMDLEHRLAFPPKVCVERRKVETLQVRQLIPNNRIPGEYIEEFERNVKRDMAGKIADKLLEDGYICFMTAENGADPIWGSREVRARLDVVRPML